MTGVIANPFADMMKRLKRPAPGSGPDAPRDHETLVSLAGLLVGLLADRMEWHEEVIDSSGVTIYHRLGRRPVGCIDVRRTGNRVIYDDYDQWNDKKIVRRTGAGSITAVFAIIGVLLLAALPAFGTECAQYGYTQGDVVRLWLCAAATDTTTGANEGDYRYNKDTNAVLAYDGAAWNAVGGGGGAPTNAQYWVGAADATLSAEHNLGALSTGLVINTTGTPSAYTGTSCTNQFPRSLSAIGAATCASVASADLNITGTTCTNQFLSALSSSAAGTCTTATLASAQFANQGAITQVLHGNALGNPSWGSVDLTNDTSSVLPLAKLTDDATASLCLISGGGGGDPIWDTCPGGGGGLSYAQVAAAVLAGF